MRRGASVVLTHRAMWRAPVVTRMASFIPHSDDGSHDLVPGNDREMENFLLFYSRKRPTSITMKELFEFGRSPTPTTMLLAAQFLHEELPIRLAQRVRQLKHLPMGLADMPGIKAVRHLYEDSFRSLRKLPKPRTAQDEQFFTQVLSDIKEKHRNLQLLVAEALQELCTRSEAARNHDFSNFLDKFYSSRIAIRLMLGQHIALHHPREGYVGVIQDECSAMDCAQMAIQAASELCSHYYGDAPVVNFDGKLDLKFTYVPAHVYYVLFELLKNSMRATAEFHADRDEIPQINMVFAEGKRDICIKISDKGGGIPREDIPKIWNYTYTTASMNKGIQATPMAGFGHGLPFSRLYCRYFGGNLEVISMEGFGTDVYVYLNKIGDTVDEELSAV